MSSTKNYITRKGAEKLREEIRFLLKEERPKLVETVAWAASNGDRSENGDYIYGKKRLREIDRRVGFLNKRLDSAHVIDPSSQESEKVLFGATVTAIDEEGEQKTFQIVGVDETQPEKGKISWTSPIGRGFLGKQVGDVVEIKTPKGAIEYEISGIKYVEID